MVEIYFSAGLRLGGLHMETMLKEEAPEVRREILTLVAQQLGEEPPSSFDYADMSPDALHGPPLPSFAFAGILVSTTQLDSYNAKQYCAR